MAAIPMTDSKCAWPQAHRDRRGAATQKILKPVPERFDEPEHWKREDIWACTKTIGWLSADSSRVASALGRLCEKSPVLADSEPEFPPAWQACIPWISGPSRKLPLRLRSLCGHPGQYPRRPDCCLMSRQQSSFRRPYRPVLALILR